MDTSTMQKRAALHEKAARRWKKAARLWNEASVALWEAENIESDINGRQPDRTVKAVKANPYDL